ncbi:MAG: hypothetical protein KAS73_06230 [Candidatus Sabulitectum sp.]|nr:hypothetical protein [Candidatus Sabulitectum sp.]
MKVFIVLFISAVTAFGYGYWDAFGVGGRVESLNPASAGLCGAAVPNSLSALSLFTNPSALAGSDRIQVSLAGWGTGWREEITYHYTCVEPSRFNMGAMTPRGAFAVTIPVWRGLTAGAGIATVSQYQMIATVQEYHEVGFNHRELWKTMVTDANGDLTEALVSFSGGIGPVSLGVSPGIRFGSGGSTTYSNRVSGGPDFDSTYVESWEHSEFAIRAGGSVDVENTTIYSSLISGDSRFHSYAGLGAAFSFSFLEGGFIGSELAVLDESSLKMIAFANLPSVIPNSNMLLGVCGYRPEGALKTGLGLSMGGDYSFGASNRHRISAAYQYQSRYREGVAVPVSYINHVFDSGETIMVGFETGF